MLTQELEFVLVRVENTEGKGKNSVYKHLLNLPKLFQKKHSLPVSNGGKKAGLFGKDIIISCVKTSIHLVPSDILQNRQP